jgi:SnoaL-like protein
VDRTGEEVIALERSALDRWITGNPQAYLDLYAPDVTYFDPFREKRVDGLRAMRTLFAPLRDAKPPFTDPRYEMIDPENAALRGPRAVDVQPGELREAPGQSETVLARWNATEGQPFDVGAASERD